MTAQMRRRAHLRLDIDVTDNPDWPEVAIYVDGVDPFAEALPDGHGFDPGDILGSASPLAPDALGRRVAVRRCSCGEAGCGVVAPFIQPAPDGSAIAWTDFRDYTGVFTGSTVEETVIGEGKTWEIPDIRFDPRQYLGEVRRATSDRSWETPRRKSARLLRDELSVRAMTISGGRLGWVAPAHREDGILLSFLKGAEEGVSPAQVLLHLLPTSNDPAEASREMVALLASHKPGEWADRFKWRRGQA
jgi:hypothetical protein